jgi:hypothetical protein
LSDVKESESGLTAYLTLAGPACNAFGTDIRDLTIKVTYESNSRYVSYLLRTPFLFLQRLNIHFRCYTTRFHTSYLLDYMSTFSTPRASNIPYQPPLSLLLVARQAPPPLAQTSSSTTTVCRLPSGLPAARTRRPHHSSTPELARCLRRRYHLWWPETTARHSTASHSCSRTNTFR